MRLAALLLSTTACGAVTLSPANHATRVNPDTHLVLTFSSAPTLSKSGAIRIYDAADHQLVDTVDLSIPAGPDPSHRVTSPTPTAFVNNDPTSPTTTTPAVRTTPADLHNYQLTTIGGLSDFHFYPVIIHENVATIYPHNNVLKYAHEYIVQIDAGVLSDDAFTWQFTTKAAGPAASASRVVVAADGSGDFSTIQGAVDFIPDSPAQRVTVFIKNGNYEEIVFFRKKSNITFRGEDREKVQVGYGNNSAFNPPMPGPSRRCAFSAYDSTGIEFINFTINNYYTGQAEALLISGSKNIVSHMTLKGSGDALNLRGATYLEDSTIIGDGDTILGVGPAFFIRCELQSIGPFMWIRNTDANHGNVFVNSTFIALERRLPWNQTAPTPPSHVLARLPNNHGLNYPYAEAVLINCKLKGVPPAAWGPIDDDTTHIRFLEFNSMDMDGHPIDVSQRHPVSKQLKPPADAKTIADYSNPAFVLGGWTPVVDR
jgi:pectinesterase